MNPNIERVCVSKETMLIKAIHRLQGCICEIAMLIDSYYTQPPTLLKMSCYSSITMCQYWDNWLISTEYTDYFTNMSQ